LSGSNGDARRGLALEFYLLVEGEATKNREEKNIQLNSIGEKAIEALS
jgi:hypothetical protein